VRFLAVFLIAGSVAGGPDQLEAPVVAQTETTVVDLADEWTPQILSETADLPQSYRRTFVALANQRVDAGSEWDTARRDQYFELFGIFPSVSVVKGWLLDGERHACHSSIHDSALRSLGRTLAPWTVPAASAKAAAAAAVTAVQQHLSCEGFLGPRSREGTFDAGTQEGLRLYQRRHMLPSAGILDEETRATFLTDSRELDFRTLLRILRERVVDATGLIEDGSALNAWRPILGRYIESSEYRRTLRSAPLPGGAPDLVDPATEAAAIALGWTSPEAAARTLSEAPVERIAVQLPLLPAYYRTPLRLRAEIDRGDVWTSYPLDDQGRPRPSPVKNRPTFTLYVQTDGGEIPLIRWPTTIGGWKEEKEDGEETLRYKESPVGRRYWRDLVAAPAWFPPPTTPDRELVRRRPDGRWAADSDAVGPGYRSAYGLVALFHHRLIGQKESGAAVTLSGTPESGEATEASDDDAARYVDIAIRTHGSGNYRSILRGSSHGCHRLFNHLAIRLGSFILAHTDYKRHGLIRERYGRVIVWKGQAIKLRAESRGYRYELTPPIAVDVLPGRTVRSKALPVTPGGTAPAMPQPPSSPAAPGPPQT
jgi:hypothetical protein